MYIVHISSELAPVAKVGGLADVVFGLSRELEIRGNDVEIILPKYDCLWYGEIWGLDNSFSDLWVPWFDGSIHCSVYSGMVHGRRCFFIEPHSSDNFFNRNKFYGEHDDIMRFAFFSRAAIEFLLKSGKRPNIIHCHDWQTGLVPVLLWEIYHNLGMQNQRVVYTIHNFQHQGVHGEPVLNATGLGRPDYYFSRDRLGDDGNPEAINLMKGGIVYSSFVTTVSPKHAWEARYSDQGQGLGHTLAVHDSKFGGVLNGVDYDVWNPEIDRFLPNHYDVWRLDGKYANKDALRGRLMLRHEYSPIISYVGRLDHQKGLHLVRHALFYALQRGAQFVLLGSSPDPAVNDEFHHLKNHLNENPDVHIELGFNEQLAHLIYAGSDMVIVPSIFEPCGLTQMIGLRYGSVPIVRAVGGLADTVFDRDYADMPYEGRNGYLFHNTDFSAVESAMDRAIGLWYDFPKEFRRLLSNGMAYDYSWNHPAQHYLSIYHHVCA
ncbi:MAG: starch synthase [Candidatus Kentron sp. G]|nr:MAG: starch synthase [Candidatus Kentron sp. G]VFM96224.1 MAG: starch synthase [Candidatus Kentron sp. G]VFM98108.1 MAG: starch synthase [Candidatus Kentron sp. G]